MLSRLVVLSEHVGICRDMLGCCPNNVMDTCEVRSVLSIGLESNPVASSRIHGTFMFIDRSSNLNSTKHNWFST